MREDRQGGRNRMKEKLVRVLALMVVLALMLPALALARDYYWIDDSDTRRLTRAELSDYDKDDLGYIRNEILARHGYPFQTEKYADYFGSQDWYERDEGFSFDRLSATEARNVELIKQLEAEYGEDEDTDRVDEDYIISDSDVRLLTKSELRSYSLDDLGYIRNEILARHGYPFKTEKYRDYFENMWWYERDENFDYNWLSSTESKNVELIKKIEQEKTR